MKAEDPIVEANRQLLLERSQVGIKKYGVTLGASGLSDAQFARHALEEALDLANYLQGFIQRTASRGEPSEREAFEAWAEGDGYDLERADGSDYRIQAGSYLSNGTTLAWHIWQAARASHGAQAPDDELPPLPEPDHSLDCGMQPFYRADQMQTYARAALANRASSAKAEKGGYCADCNSWGGEHKDNCERRPERFFTEATPASDTTAVQALAARLESLGVTNIGITPGPNATPEKVAAEIMRALDEIEGKRAPASDTRAAVLLNAEEMAALRRFNETCEDGEGYDVRKEMMKRLATIGVVRRTSGSIYEITEFGMYVLDGTIASAVEKSWERFTAQIERQRAAPTAAIAEADAKDAAMPATQQARNSEKP